ncbi:MAG: ABC transporter ATP-binding protein [Myxococcales bacterium]|nr:ABC transporter ATP-binding protein [Myxococcales bacterium]
MTHRSTTEEGSSVLEATDIVKTFGEGEGATLVLRGVSAKVERGEFVALVGPSGSGKSTFLSIAGTLLTPSGGSLRIAGVSALGLGEAALSEVRNRHLGFVFQFHHLLVDFTALENVLMPVYGAHTWHKAEFGARARELLDRVGLTHRMSLRASKLSGGQKQRVAVARALIMKPALILADEPTGNLDRKSSDEVLALLRELSKDEGTAFLISTHDESIARRCDRVLSMEDGRLVGS